VATKSVHEETILIVDEQMNDIGIQMQALDDFVTRARSQNAQHHDSHTESLEILSSTVRGSYENIGNHFAATYERVRELDDEMSTQTGNLRQALSPLEATLREPLANLRSNISNSRLEEYVPTGETPQKVQYMYPTELPRTEAHEKLLASIRPSSSSSAGSTKVSVVFNDPEEELVLPVEERIPVGLKEIDVNVVDEPLRKSGIRAPKLLKKPSIISLEGRENNIFSQSTGRRRSPRTN
jgi:kinesin family protein 11